MDSLSKNVVSFHITYVRFLLVIESVYQTHKNSVKEVLITNFKEGYKECLTVHEEYIECLFTKPFASR